MLPGTLGISDSGYQADFPEAVQLRHTVNRRREKGFVLLATQGILPFSEWTYSVHIRIIYPAPENLAR